MTRLLVAAAIVAAAIALAALLSRRSPRREPVGLYPSSVDVRELGLPLGGIAVFTDPACFGCAEVVARVVGSGRSHVVVEADDPRRPSSIRHFPTTLEVGPDGAVRRGWLGPLPPGALE